MHCNFEWKQHLNLVFYYQVLKVLLGDPNELIRTAMQWRAVSNYPKESVIILYQSARNSIGFKFKLDGFKSHMVESFGYDLLPASLWYLDSVLSIRDQNSMVWKWQVAQKTHKSLNIYFEGANAKNLTKFCHQWNEARLPKSKRRKRKPAQKYSQVEERGAANAIKILVTSKIKIKYQSRISDYYIEKRNNTLF